jgi:hypothetical protein
MQDVFDTNAVLATIALVLIVGIIARPQKRNAHGYNGQTETAVPPIAQSSAAACADTKMADPPCNEDQPLTSAASATSLPTDVAAPSESSSTAATAAASSPKFCVGATKTEGGLQAQALAECEPPDLELTEQQEAILATFRTRLLDEGLLLPHFDNKPYLYRWCMARKFDLEKALQMFRADAEWRNARGLNEMAASPLGPIPKPLLEFVYPEYRDVKRAYPHAYHKTDRSGRMIYVDCAGRINSRGLLQATSLERLLDWYVYELEMTFWARLPSCSLRSGHLAHQYLIICDLQGFAITKFNADARKVIRMVAKLCSDHYPETMAETYIVNTPWIFRTVWAFIAPLLDPRTRGKMRMLGGAKEFVPVLRSVVDAECLPTFLGGTDTTCDCVRDQGPWATVLPDVSQPRPQQ